MKKKFILLPIAGLLAYIIFSSYSAGPTMTALYNGTGSEGLPAGCYNSGAPGGCHATAPAPEVSVNIQLFSGTTLVTSYSPGASYTVRMTGTYTASTAAMHPNFGFQITCLPVGSTTINAGTWGSAMPPSTHVWTSVDGINVAEHGASLPATSGGGASGSTYVVNIPWTAPAAGTGPVKIWGIVNLVNPPVSPSPSSDKWQTTTSTYPEATSTVGAITGSLTACVGATSTLSCTPAGGTWSSSTPSVGTVSSAGVVGGISTGTTTITYHATAGNATAVVTVNPSPAPVSGTPSVCVTASTTLSCVTLGGTWSSATTSVATVGSLTGVVDGLSVGTSTISYTVGGCSSTKIFTVNASGAAPITGTANVCVASTITLSNLTPGGTWTSSVPAKATVGSATGIVSGVAVGTTVISYTATNSCGVSTTTKTINVLPAGSCTTGVSPVTSTITVGLSVFPNPNYGSFTLNMESLLNEEAHVVVYGVAGNKVKEFTTSTNSNMEIHIPRVAGMYFVSVTTGQGNYVTKVMVQ